MQQRFDDHQSDAEESMTAQQADTEAEEGERLGVSYGKGNYSQRLPSC